MPIQITREEYEKKFGVKPFVASTEEVVDTKPAPIQITRAEWNKMQNQSVSPTFGQDTKQDFFDMGASLNQSIGRAGRGIVDTFKDDDLNVADKTVVAGGKTLRGISDFLGDAFIGLSKLALPQHVEDRVKEKMTEEVENFKNAEKTDFRNPTGGILVGEEFNQKLSDSIFESYDDHTDRREKDPRYKKLTDSILDNAMGAADLYGGSKALDATGDALGKVDDLVPDVGDFKETVTNALDARSAAKRQQELFDIENSYSKLRKDKTYSSDENAGSRARIADANIWDNVVDTDGDMTTLGRGGAYEQYKAATIDGSESVIRDNLVREGATININELARQLKINILDSGLEGSALESALKGINREIQGLSRRADELGNVPLQNVQDFKTSTTKTINYKTDNNPTIKFKKAKAQTYKEVVENKSKVEVEVDGKKYSVAGINKELAKYYQDLELIRSLDGRKVRGGKLGKYFSQISGNLIGGAAGGAVGGPVGMAIGTVVGGEAAGFLKGRKMAASLGKGGKGVPANPVLDAARKEAGLPPVKDLKTPDKPVGAPKGTPKTKEITKVEGQIKNNVKQQNKAIKAGNFGLVAELKEVFAYLVIQLKEMVVAAKAGIKSQGGFASIKGSEAPDARRFSKKKLTDDQLDETIDALMDYDTTPITVKQTSTAVSGGQKDMLASSKVDDRLAELQRKNQTKRLSKVEIEEANELLVKAGVIADPQSKSVGKRNTQYNKTATASKTDITQSTTDPTLKTKREVIAKTNAGEKFTIPEGTVVTPLVDGGKVKITVGKKDYTINKNQYQNLIGQSDVAKATPFAPELKDTVESVRGASNWDGYDLMVNGERKADVYIGPDEDSWHYRSDFVEESPAFDSRALAMENAEADVLGINSGADTKYSQYTLDGGENYREIIVQAPTDSKFGTSKAKLDSLANEQYSKPYGELNTSQKSDVDNIMRSRAEGGNNDVGKQYDALTYKSSHWDETNPLFHLRHNNRTWNGKKVEFMEEGQSDWAREGREKGFKADSSVKKDDLKVMSVGENGRYAVTLDGDVLRAFNSKKSAESNIEAVYSKLASGELDGGKVPNHPLLKNWQIPAAKRSLMEAVDNKADVYAWINGAQTSERYKLSTQVESVGWSSNSKGIKTIDLKPQNNVDQIDMAIDENGVIKASSKGEFVDKKLDEVLGKGMADSIMSKKSGTLEGEGLNFGGEWASNLYDRQWRDIIKKLTGAEVKTADMGLGDGSKTDVNFMPEGWEVARPIKQGELKVGTEISKEKSAASTLFDPYVIISVGKNGKFKAVPQKQFELYENSGRDWDKIDIEMGAWVEDFDISTGNQTQQYIELTPEVVAKIQSKAPNFKMKNPSAGEALPLIFLLLGGGAVATQS